MRQNRRRVPSSPRHQALQEADLAFEILTTSVVGSIVPHVLSGGRGRSAGLTRLPPALQDLQGAFNARFRTEGLVRQNADRVQTLGIPARLPRLRHRQESPTKRA